MPISAAMLKQRAYELIDRLPESATWDDVIEEARFRKAVESGIAAAADRKDFAEPDEIRAAFAKCGVKIEAQVDESSATQSD